MFWSTGLKSFLARLFSRSSSRLYIWSHLNGEWRVTIGKRIEDIGLLSTSIYIYTLRVDIALPHRCPFLRTVHVMCVPSAMSAPSFYTRVLCSRRRFYSRLIAFTKTIVCLGFVCFFTSFYFTSSFSFIVYTTFSSSASLLGRFFVLHTQHYSIHVSVKKIIKKKYFGSSDKDRCLAEVFQRSRVYAIVRYR